MTCWSCSGFLTASIRLLCAYPASLVASFASLAKPCLHNYLSHRQLQLSRKLLHHLVSQVANASMPCYSWIFGGLGLILILYRWGTLNSFLDFQSKKSYLVYSSFLDALQQLLVARVPNYQSRITWYQFFRLLFSDLLLQKPGELTMPFTIEANLREL